MEYRIIQHGEHKDLETFGTVAQVSDFNDPSHPHFELWSKVMANIIGYVVPKPLVNQLVLICEINALTWLVTLDFSSKEELQLFYPLIKMTSTEDKLKDLATKAFKDIQPYKESQPLAKEKDLKAKRPYYNKNRPF